MIKVFTKTNCIQCKMTKKLMEQLKIDFQELKIDDDTEALNYLKNKGIKSVPYVETKKENWFGFRPDKIKQIQ